MPAILIKSKLIDLYTIRPYNFKTIYKNLNLKKMKTQIINYSKSMNLILIILFLSILSNNSFSQGESIYPLLSDALNIGNQNSDPEGIYINYQYFIDTSIVDREIGKLSLVYCKNINVTFSQNYFRSTKASLFKNTGC